MHQSKENLYCQFYQHTDQETLLQLYVSIVHPHLEYAAPVWDPHMKKDQDLLESTQKFACKMTDETKNWDKGYDELLYMKNLPSLAVTRSYTSTPLTLYQPFTHTNCLSLFIPLELTSRASCFSSLPCNFYTYNVLYTPTLFSYI